MTHPRRFVALLAIISASVYAATSEPNAQPNPYRTIENWAKLPDGRTWGSAAGVDIDSHGHVWVAERCGANSCGQDRRSDPGVRHIRQTAEELWRRDVRFSARSLCRKGRQYLGDGRPGKRREGASGLQI